jgi:hypothetical protein
MGALVPIAFGHCYAELHQFDDAWRCVDEALTLIEKTKERWCEAEVNRIAGEIMLNSPERDATKAAGVGLHDQVGVRHAVIEPRHAETSNDLQAGCLAVLLSQSRPYLRGESRTSNDKC